MLKLSKYDLERIKNWYISLLFLKNIEKEDSEINEVIKSELDKDFEHYILINSESFESLLRFLLINCKKNYSKCNGDKTSKRIDSIGNVILNIDICPYYNPENKKCELHKCLISIEGDV